MSMEIKMALGVAIGMLDQCTRAELVLACFASSLCTGDFDRLHLACSADDSGDQAAQRDITLKLLEKVLPLKNSVVAIHAAMPKKHSVPSSLTPDFAR